MWQMIGTDFLCSMLISRYKKKKSAWKRAIYGVLNQCKQYHDISLVYRTKNGELSISLITLQMTLKFHFVTRNALPRVL